MFVHESSNQDSQFTSARSNLTVSDRVREFDLIQLPQTWAVAEKESSNAAVGQEATGRTCEIRRDRQKFSCQNPLASRRLGIRSHTANL